MPNNLASSNRRRRMCTAHSNHFYKISFYLIIIKCIADELKYFFTILLFKIKSKTNLITKEV